MQTIKSGDYAPNFSLTNQFGDTVQLGELLARSKVLVYFYPKAMTPGCTVQACQLRDHQAMFDEKNVTIVGISTDAVKSLLKFSERDQLKFILLSDPDHQVAEGFGVWGEKKFMGKIYDGIHRISFLIGQDGKVEQVFDTFKTSNHHEVVLAALA